MLRFLLMSSEVQWAKFYG